MSLHYVVHMFDSGHEMSFIVDINTLLFSQLEEPGRYGIYEMQSAHLNYWKRALVILMFVNVLIHLPIEDGPFGVHAIEEDKEKASSLCRLRIRMKTI